MTRSEASEPEVPQGFDILREEGPCLLVGKPGGVLTQAPPGIDSLEVRIKRFLKERENKPGGVYLGVPHRLDRPVSGVLVVCKHVRAARRLSEQFQNRSVEKKYWAVVEGVVRPAHGSWVDSMRKIPDVAKAEIVAAGHPDARQAVLHFRRLVVAPNASLMEFELETGRMHQIRLQAATRGHPVCGDHLYGSEKVFGPETNDPRARWIALHAICLGFVHPMTKLPLRQHAPLPRPWWTSGLPDEIVEYFGSRRADNPG
jgi:23S rRNA pseudouridine1911/1915/1917 synthase